MRGKSVRTKLLACVFSVLPMLLQAQQEKRPQPGTKLSDEQIKEWVAPMRAGRKLTPKSWPNGAKVAVCISWDMDNETFEIAAGNSPTPAESAVISIGRIRCSAPRNTASAMSMPCARNSRK